MSHQGHGGTHFTSWAQTLIKASCKEIAPIQGSQFTFDGKALIVCGEKGCHVLNPSTLECLHIVNCNGENGLRGFCLSKDNILVLATGNNLNTFQLQVDTGNVTSQLLFSTSCHEPETLAIHNDLLATGSSDGMCQLSKIVPQTEIHVEILPDSGSKPVLCLGFSSDGKKLAVGFLDGDIRIWITVERTLWCSIHGHKGPVHAIKFGMKRTANLVISCGSDGLAKAWNIVEGKGTQNHLDYCNGCYCFIDPSVTIKFKSHTSAIKAAELAENGDVLCTAAEDGSIKLWLVKPHNGVESIVARSLTGGGAMATVAYSQKISRLATITAKGTMKIWGIVPHTGQKGMFAK
eukprot:m.11791 g.11791  ORF g.11791 m.11791 type:complete len:348 (-) comp4524_c0_seq1:2682-3725(-)